MESGYGSGGETAVAEKPESDPEMGAGEGVNEGEAAEVTDAPDDQAAAGGGDFLFHAAGSYGIPEYQAGVAAFSETEEPVADEDEAQPETAAMPDPDFSEVEAADDAPETDDGPLWVPQEQLRAEELRAKALDAALKVSHPGKPVYEVVRDAERFLAFLRDD